jgi:hypothetical protein
MKELETNEADQEELEQSNLNLKRSYDAETAKLKTAEQQLSVNKAEIESLKNTNRKLKE